MKKFKLCWLFTLATISLTSAVSCGDNNSGIETKEATFSLTIEGKGKVSGFENGKYAIGTTINLTATPDNGYEFNGYYLNNEVVTKEATYTFKLEKDTSLIAKFNEVKVPETQDVIKTYGHTFNNIEILATANTTEAINGLSWTHTEATYLGGPSGNYKEGIQIGSSSKPMTENYWTIETSFPKEATLISYSLELGNAKSGEGNYIISYANKEDTSDFSHPGAYQVVSKDNINVKTSNFKISIKSLNAKALYLGKVTFTLSMPKDNTFDISEDESGEIVDPTPDPTPGEGPKPGEGLIPNVSFKETKEEYYKNINISSSTVLSDLSTLIGSVNQTTYGDARYMLCYTDQNIKDGGKTLNGLFDGANLTPTWDQGKTWNREHVWPVSLLGASRPNNSDFGISTDLHNLRACTTTVNSSHGNKMYGDGNDGTYYPNVKDNDYRGDVARVIFYMVTRYDEFLNIGDSLSGSGNYMGNASLLKSWAKADPVDAFEIQRNERIYGFQGNRNPFIDFPELVDKLVY